MTTDMAEIEARLGYLEDEREVSRLIASYGPLVDSADADGACALWDDDGSYDVEGWRMNSRADVHAMVSSPSHRELVAGGCCHFLGPAVVTVDGDTAVGVCESLVLLRADGTSADRVDSQAWRSAPGEFVVWRATANHFVVKRVEGRWSITARTSRLLDGNAVAHSLLTDGLAGVTRQESCGDQ